MRGVGATHTEALAARCPTWGAAAIKNRVWCACVGSAAVGPLGAMKVRRCRCIE